MLRTSQDVVISNAGTISESATVPNSFVAAAVITPAALTGTAFTFRGSFDRSNFFNIYNGGTQYSVNVGTSRYIALDTNIFKGLNAIQVVSGSAEGASRTIGIVFVKE
jgi:hypothetical protein